MARQRLRPTVWTASEGNASSSDHDLNPDTEWLHREFRAAAVLIPIVARSPLTVLLTERTPNLSAHAGQIAFPGGKIESFDASPLDAALREAREEIGLAAEFVEPLGFLDGYQTGTGFLISPVVGLVSPGFEIVPDPAEVASVFEVPLAFLMDLSNHRIDSRNFRGSERRFYAMPYADRYIWGVTAGIIRMLHKRLFAA